MNLDKLLKKNSKYDALLLAGLTSNLFYSMSYPIVHTICIKDLSSNLLSFTSLLSCILAIILSQAWLKYSDKLYKTFGISLLLEGILYAILLVLFLSNKMTPAMYYVWDSIIMAIITRNIISGGNRLKAMRYRHEEREIFDNKSTLYCNISCVIGFGFSSIITLSTNMAFILMWIGMVVDNAFYYLIYRKESKQYD